MAWVDLSSAFGFGTLLTSSQMQNLRDNITAAFNKDAGAPVLANDYVVTAMIADNQVTTAKLATGEQMTTANVDGAIAGSSVGAVGTYAFCHRTSSTQTNPGDTVAGSTLRYSDTNDSTEVAPTALSGTWRCMGYIAATGGAIYSSLFLRIS